MNQHIQIHDAEIIDQAMAAFLLDSVSAKNKHKKVKANMECRRKLEIKWEQKRLEREISEFDFN
ncbi:MAG: hypothetical protein EOO52_10275 [Gammaproteobacteria bacterium]|nr:MAG: hypothetical protein EOO52_10275 [Gammaproteobacteria bacterium]